jgi:hypothetical protein
MNTNDFYKELFEKYALDEEKIRRNAIKAAKTPAWQRAVSAHWKTAVGAAAAVAVTVGAVAYTVGNGAGNVIDIDSSDDLLTATQRLREAEKDYYNKEYSKEGDISEENKQKLKDMDEEIKSLEETPEIKAILAAIKNREALRKMMDQLNKLEPVVKELPKSRNQYVKIIDRVDEDPDSENVYEGSSVQKAAQERTDYFRNWDNRLVLQEEEPPRRSLV